MSLLILILTKVGKEIETNVNKLAAKARAAGIHLVVATQRPSTDVITGVIKANFPTRVAFTVTSGIDSRTILDKMGAEKLLKRGDMLYKHGTELVRMHSSFIEEEEIEGLIDKLSTVPQEFNQGAMDFLENGGDEIEDEPEVKVSFKSGTTDDPVYDEAVQLVMQKGSASASMLQRALRVGYNRAANIIDEMERNGIIGPAQGSKPRKVLARSE
jgi:S-DNA-T family DNA segregation ATPase FtsK/SpoIIIE